MDRFRLKNDAKADIRGKVWLALQPLMIMYIINYVIGFFSSAAETTDKQNVYIALTVIYSVLAFVYAVLYFSMYVGACRYYLGFVNKQYMSWTVIFDGMKNSKQFGQQFLCYLLTDLIIAAGTVCLIVPGIYFAMRYSLIGYIFAENPDMKWRDAMKRSSALMEGHIFEEFCLIFSFFWWWCLCAITFGLAAIYVAPYMSCTMARYYLSLKYTAEGYTFDGGATGGTAGGSNPFQGDAETPSAPSDGETKYPFDIN